MRPPLQNSQEIFPNETGGLEIQLGDNTFVDAFGRQRISDPVTIFDTSFEYDKQPLLWQESTSETGVSVHNANRRCVVMTVGAGSGEVMRRTYSYHRYQPGKSQRVILTFVLGTAQAGVVREIGYFDDSDGLFLRQTEAGLYLVMRSSTGGTVVETAVPQSTWQRPDVIINPTSRQIFDLDFEWLGAGRVRFGFNLNGRTAYLHSLNNANVSVDNAPYIRTGSLPVTYRINTTGTSSSADLVQICSSVLSEGGFEEERGIPQSANNGAAAIGVTTRRPVLSLRPKALFPGTTFVNRGYIRVESVSALAQTNPALIEVVYNGQLSGASWGGYSGTATTIAEYDTGATGISGGMVIYSTYVAASGAGANAREVISLPVLSRLPVTLDKDGGNPQTVSVVATSLNATSSITTTLNWREIR